MFSKLVVCTHDFSEVSGRCWHWQHQHQTWKICKTFRYRIGRQTEIWHSSISSMCKKAAKQLNALKRIGHFLDQFSRLTIFRAYIMSNFNYCPLVWHFCSKKNLSKLERIQERALSFVYRDYKISYEELLDQAKLQSLYLGRLRSLATEIHKAVHGGAPPYVSSLFTERESEYSLRRNHSLILPQYNTISFGKQSIRYTGPKVWNSLPNTLRQTTSLKELKNLISTWSGTNCTCSLCCFK